jgi:Ran GTPase-activating protein (RanGAP) involved in mRNA processing and transport
MQLQSLFLNDNSIKSRSAEALTKICLNSRLKEFSLRWNQLCTSGICTLMRTFRTEECGNLLVSLDLSFNHLTQDLIVGTRSTAAEKSKCKSSHEIASYLKSNKSVRHVDLSGNMLDQEDFRILGKGLFENQTLIGLHIEENPGGSLDARGFLSVGQEYDHASSLNIPCMCWICGGML